MCEHQSVRTLYTRMEIVQVLSMNRPSLTTPVWDSTRRRLIVVWIIRQG